MKFRKLLTFVIQSVVVGLAAAVLLLFVRPDLFQGRPPEVVEFRQGPATPGERPLESGPVSYAHAVELTAPAVVNIFTAKLVRERSGRFFDDPALRQFFGDRFPSMPQRRLESSLGSGVIISPQGYVLTNYHVIAEADEIQVALRDGRNAGATVVGVDPESDLAVLKVQLDNLPAITLGQSDTLRVGDVVLAIGNPFGVGQTVTMGIVSATGRDRLGLNTYENFIQTDAAVNPGNSGGALVNAYGQLVGINTAIFSRSGGSQGIGFAIPVSLAGDIMQEIIQHGRVIRGWLGIEAQDLTAEMAASLRLRNIKGVLVSGVLRGGPADRAGLQPGDVITAVNNEPIIDSKAAMKTIAQVKPGTVIHLQGVRGAGRFELDVQVTERPPVVRPPQ